MKRNITSYLIMLFTALSLTLCSLTLAGCGGSEQEQANCYGDDMPVVNE